MRAFHATEITVESCGCHAIGVPDKLVTTHEEYHRLGKTPEDRQIAYREPFRSELESSELAEIRETVNTGWLLGSDRFEDEIESALRRAVRPPKRGRPARNGLNRLPG